MRRAVFAHLDVSAGVVRQMRPGVTWGSWTVPIGIELVLVLSTGIVLLAVAVAGFRRAE